MRRSRQSRSRKSSEIRRRSGYAIAASTVRERIRIAAATSASAPRPSSRSTAPSGETRSTGRRPSASPRRYAAFAADDDARVLVVTGAGGAAFCAGADLKAIETSPRGSTTPAARSGSPGASPPKPAIAAIEGWCLAGGLELALWCDLRIATEGSRLGFTERRFGVPLIDGGTQRLPRIVGLGRALDLILSGRVVETDEALALGLVGEVVLPGRHVARALEIAEGLAAFPQAAMLADRRAATRASGSRSPTAWRSRRAARARRSPTRGRARRASPRARAAAGQARGFDGRTRP